MSGRGPFAFCTARGFDRSSGVLRPIASSRALLLLGIGLALAGMSPACAKPQDLSTEQLSAVVDAQRPSLKQCYDTALAQTPYTQEIRMQAMIDVQPSGKVSGVELEGGGGLPGMTECIRTAIAHWRFPKAKDPTSTSLPLIFKPEVAPPQPTAPLIEELRRQLGAARGAPQ
jgi:hypothetical protein